MAWPFTRRDGKISGDTSPSFWSEPLAELMERLRASQTGLSTAEAEARLAESGPNSAVAVVRPPAWRQFVRRLANPLILLLLLASGLSALAGDLASFIIVAAIVLLSVVLDFIQERQAEHTMEALARSVAVKADVMRDGTVIEVPVETLVPGDVVMLDAGDLVPADCRLIEARDLLVNQALLTGESYPVEKRAVDLGEKADSAATATNSVFLATLVATGSARAVVCVTGKATRLGHVARTLHEPAPLSTFELGVNQFGMLMLRLTVFMVVFVLITNVLFNRPFLQSLMFALALAVALTPELLPAIITVTLARGAKRLAERKVVVKRLAAIHNLGAMDVLCTDKTGTLTEARIELARHVDHAGAESERVLQLAFLNSHFSNGVLSPLDRAILDHDAIDATGWRKLDEVPFDYQRRRVSLLLESKGERCLIVKGGPEDVLAVCTSYEAAEGERRTLDGAAMARILEVYHQLSSEGFRLLAVAFRPVESGKAEVAVADENALVFVGYVAFFDPPKESAGETVRALAGLGVDLKILTGDGELVTRHVCAELGIPVTGALGGKELAALSEPALLARLERTNLFFRMEPEDKRRVVAALRRRGWSVGYLGDGVNDAPALHAADVGISVDAGASVAKETASIILLEHDLSVVRDAVLEGRRAVENAMKYILMGTSSNFGNMFSMAGAALILPILPMLPVQVLLNNLLYDVSELGMPFDNVDEETLRHPVRWDLHLIKRFMLVLGPVSSIFDFLTFFVLLRLFHAGAAEFQTGWFVESLATQALVVFAIRSRKPFLRSHPHPILVVLAVGAAAVAAILPLTPVGAWFGLVPLPWSYYVFVGTAVAAYVALVELIKPLLLRAAPDKHDTQP